jgi:hypothetical protein
MSDQGALTVAASLWRTAVKRGLLDAVDPDTVVGAHYAELALRGDVTLTDVGASKVKAASEALEALMEGEDT